MTELKMSVARGAAYIYIETIASMLSGYIFWIVMSKIATIDIIGTSSAVISLSGIVAVAANIGVPTGIQRFLGKSFSEQNLEDAKAYAKLSLLIVSVGVLVCSTTIFVFGGTISHSFKFDFSLMFITILLLISTAISNLFRGILISSMKTRSLPVTMILSSILKLLLAIVLVLIGTGALGLTVGYTVSQILSCLILGIVILMVFRQPSKYIREVRYVPALKNILSASVVFWIPFLITTVGIQLATIVVYGSQGSGQAGVFFMALTIVTGITSVMYSLFTIGLPALSSMKDGRKKFVWHMIRLSLIFALPFSSILIFYSGDILRLLGTGYARGSLPLDIMLVSMLPTAVQFGISSLLYSYGNYKQVLIVGLAMSIPRVVLYFILVPVYGNSGAATGYTIGAVIGLIVSLIIAKNIGMLIFWRHILYILFIPIGVGLAFKFSNTNYIIGILVSLFVSYLLLLKVRAMTRNDINDLLSMLPHRMSGPINSALAAIDRKLSRCS